MPLQVGSFLTATPGIDIKVANGRLASALPSAYPIGVSTASVLSSNGWPVSGTVITICQEAARDYTSQWAMGNNVSATYKRNSSNGTSWSAWYQVVFQDEIQTLTNKSISGAANTVTALPTSALADGAVTAAKIADGTVGTAELGTNAVTAIKITDKTITALKLILGDLTNLIPDGNFLDTTKANWNAPGTLEVVTGEPNRLKVVTAASGSNDQSNYVEVPVTPGEKIWVSFEVRGETTNVGGGVPHAYVYARGDDNTNAWTTVAQTTRAAVSGVWTTVTGVYTAPTIARYVKFSLAVSYSADAVGNVYYFRRFVARRMAPTALVEDGAVTAAKIATDTITASQIAAGAVGSSELASGAVTAGKIGAGAIATADIANAAVSTAKLATDAVNTVNILNAAVSTAKLATGAVTTTNIADAAVSTAKLATDAVTTVNIANGAVTGAKIATDTITATQIAANTITAAQIVNNTITGTQVATNAAIPQSAITNLASDFTARPKGLVAAWTATANTNSATTAAELILLTFSFTAEASRSYRIALSGGLVDSESTVAQSAYCILRWQQGSAVTTSSAACGRQIVATPASSNGDLASGVHVEGLITTATAGTVNLAFTLTAANGVNTVRYFATSIPPRVYVQDMGPAVTVNTLSF